MSKHWGWAAAVAVIALFLRPGDAAAHPNVVGLWTAPLPQGAGVTVYDFAPPRFVGNGVWQGGMIVTVGGCRVSAGLYELRMFSGTEGTISIREGEAIGTAVGTIDFGTGTMNYIGTQYKH